MQRMAGTLVTDNDLPRCLAADAWPRVGRYLNSVAAALVDNARVVSAT